MHCALPAGKHGRTLLHNGGAHDERGARAYNRSLGRSLQWSPVADAKPP